MLHKTITHPTFMALCIALCQCAQPETKNTPTTANTYPTAGKIERLDPAFDAVVAPDARIEVLADGFAWAEGPLWVADGGYLLFTDIPPNRIVYWKEGEGARTWLTPAGYTGAQARGGEPGANGLLFDSKGRLVMCQHGDRRMAYLDAPLSAPKPNFVSIAERWNGKRFNSPNDAAYDRQGALYFTDPPYGLEKNVDDPAKEIPFQGVYRCRPDGVVDLLLDSLTRPNGIAFSPDQKTLYVAISDPKKALWMAYDVAEDGTLRGGRVFYDATSKVGEAMPGLPDGLKVRKDGLVFATGPGGVWVFQADGKPIGRIDTGQPTANCAFDADEKTLYMTANKYLMRIKLK